MIRFRFKRQSLIALFGCGILILNLSAFVFAETEQIEKQGDGPRLVSKSFIPLPPSEEDVAGDLEGEVQEEKPEAERQPSPCPTPALSEVYYCNPPAQDVGVRCKAYKALEDGTCECAEWEEVECGAAGSGS